MVILTVNTVERNRLGTFKKIVALSSPNHKQEDLLHLLVCCCQRSQEARLASVVEIDAVLCATHDAVETKCTEVRASYGR